jgi:hypothetical protein
MEENLEEEIDEQGRNLTQQRLDEEEGGDEPVDAPWGTQDRPDD